MKSILSIVTLIFLHAASCKNEAKPKEEHHYGPFYFGNYADYFYFKPGSYWIYENNKTGELDTCFLQQLVKDTVTFFGETSQFKNWYTTERINFYIFSSISKSSVAYQTSMPCMQCSPIDSSIHFILMRGSSSRVFYSPPHKLEGSHFYSTYQLGSETFSDVYRFDCPMSNTLTPWDKNKFNLFPTDMSFFWARGKGLIQLMYKGKTQQGQPDSASWLLKQYHLEKP